MGGNTFSAIAKRDGYQNGTTETQEGPHKVIRASYGPWPSAKAAFDSLADDSRYERGHSYNGGIGAKHDFVHIATVDTADEAGALADNLIDECDPRIDDKWGPAGCITIKEGPAQFLFFGWAPS